MVFVAVSMLGMVYLPAGVATWDFVGCGNACQKQLILLYPGKTSQTVLGRALADESFARTSVIIPGPQ